MQEKHLPSAPEDTHWLERLGTDVARSVADYLPLCGLAALMRTDKRSSAAYKAAFEQRLRRIRVNDGVHMVYAADISPGDRAWVFCDNVNVGNKQALAAMHRLGFMRVKGDRVRTEALAGYPESMLSHILDLLEGVERYSLYITNGIPHGHRHYAKVCRCIDAVMMVFHSQLLKEAAEDSELLETVKEVLSRMQQTDVDKQHYQELKYKITCLIKEPW